MKTINTETPNRAEPSERRPIRYAKSSPSRHEQDYRTPEHFPIEPIKVNTDVDEILAQITGVLALNSIFERPE